MMRIKMLLPVMLLIASTSYASGHDAIEKLDKQTVRSMDHSQLQDRMIILEQRLSEIQTFDIDAMDRTTRKETNKELRYIHKEMKAISNGGIYISTTALVIIIILLLIL